MVHSFRFGGSEFHLVAVKTFVVYYETQDGGSSYDGAVLNFLYVIFAEEVASAYFFNRA